MKIRITIFLAAIGIAGFLSAFAQPANVADSGTAARMAGANSNDLNLNFVNAPLETVLAYLGDVAGFIVVQDTPVSGTATIKGVHLTKDRVVDLLNHVLNRNGCVAIRDGRTLHIVDKENAKTGYIPVNTGYNPDAIPDNDEIAMWIIPVRFVEAQQMVSVLSPFVSAQATVTANADGNSIVVTDTQSKIRHLAKIIQAVDNSAQAGTEIRVFRLKYANPTEVADELGSVFPTSNSSSSQVAPTFDGPGGPPDFGPTAADASGTTSSGSQQRLQKAKQISAVVDSRLQAVLVSAPQNLMGQIAGIMTTLDVPSNRDQDVHMIRVQNGDPLQVAQVLQSMFSNGNTSSDGTSSQTSALQQRQQTAVTTMNQAMTSSSFSTGSSQQGSAF